jgi:ubiquinone/menaquinone biosynthesis C-methylase UbiE
MHPESWKTLLPQVERVEPFFARCPASVEQSFIKVKIMSNSNGTHTRPTNFSEERKRPKTTALIDVLRDFDCHPANILVVGCGTGSEAGILARAFGACTIGIDIVSQFTFDHAGAAPAVLMQMDARALEFPDESFDLIYSFHALEHIPGPKDAVREMSRVLRPGGRYLIGTPNKSRILGYFAAAHPLSERVMMNVHDIGMRLRGRWTNELGAHAGFTERELTEMCWRAFGESQDVSEKYYSRLYTSKARLVKRACRSAFRGFLLPCVYVSGKKVARQCGTKARVEWERDATSLESQCGLRETKGASR